MPIKPENRSRYPKDWKQIRASVLERAHHRCEFCGVENHTMRKNREGKEVRIVLTIAHLDHTPENCKPSNLRALCQKCHNRYDARHRAETRQRTKAVAMLEKQAQKCFEVAHATADPMLHEKGLRLTDKADEVRKGGLL